MKKPIRARIEALEERTVAAQTFAILIGDPSPEEIEAISRRGVRTVVILPDNGRGPDLVGKDERRNLIPRCGRENRTDAKPKTPW